MKTSRIHALVDQLLARDQCYRPIELLIASKRLDAESRQRWEKGEVVFLEDLIAGNPDRSLDLLRQAAEWARKLSLDGRVEVPTSGQQRMFRNPNNDRLAHTVWHRRLASPQADLFLDSGYAAARGRLARALVDGDMTGAEVHLAEMARAEPGNSLQADAEQLVGALDWLERSVDDPQAWHERLEADLAARARRVLDPDQGEQYLNRFRSYLSATLDSEAFDPDYPELHPAALAARMKDWPAVLDAIQAVDQAHEHAMLMEVAATAGMKSDRREVGLTAVCQLCWHHPQAAEKWLEITDDQDIAARITRFWDLDESLDIELFPAWLITVGAPVPEIDPEQMPDTPEARAMVVARRLRADPTDADSRQWLQQHASSLFNVWLNRR